MQPQIRPEFNTQTTTNSIYTLATEMGYNNGDQGRADQLMADQDMVDQKMTDRGMELQDFDMENEEGRHQRAIDVYFVTEWKTLEQESPLLPEFPELAHPMLYLGINNVQQFVKASLTDPPVLSNDACILPPNIPRNFNRFQQTQRCPWDEI